MLASHQPFTHPVRQGRQPNSGNRFGLPPPNCPGTHSLSLWWDGFDFLARHYRRCVNCDDEAAAIVLCLAATATAIPGMTDSMTDWQTGVFLQVSPCQNYGLSVYESRTSLGFRCDLGHRMLDFEKGKTDAFFFLNTALRYRWFFFCFCSSIHISTWPHMGTQLELALTQKVLSVHNRGVRQGTDAILGPCLVCNFLQPDE